MKQLKKPTKKKNCIHRARFDAACELIRQTLNIDSWRHSYDIDAEERDTSMATYYNYNDGNYIMIFLRPCFWEEETFEWQIRGLIHEHIHAVNSPFIQAFNSIIEKMHESDVQLSKKLVGDASERVTCWLEAIIYDLIKDDLSRL